jgi:ATP diphosphatase
MLDDLRSVMARLRDPETGCAWDRAQTFETIVPYTIEEAYEVADAVARGDMTALKDELGDLQLQVVFHARIAEELGAFDLDDVTSAITAKMIRRHPHLFGSGDNPGWEAIKAEERALGADRSAVAGVAHALPALSRAEKLQRRAAQTGFDWPDASGPRAKILEELDELDRASDEVERREELGDLLFAVVNLARHLGIDPETALREANAKFESRFRTMEDIAGNQFESLDIEGKEALWNEAKSKLRTGTSTGKSTQP